MPRPRHLIEPTPVPQKHVNSTVGEPLMVYDKSQTKYLHPSGNIWNSHALSVTPFIVRVAPLSFRDAPIVWQTTKRWTQRKDHCDEFWSATGTTKDYPPNNPTQGRGTPPNTFVDVLPNGFVSQGLSAGRNRSKKAKMKCDDLKSDLNEAMFRLLSRLPIIGFLVRLVFLG